MTNPNSASPSNPPSADLSRDILDKVNAHADRSIDKLFADIDELLKTDTTDAAIDTDRPFYSNSSSFTPPNSETPFTPPTYSPPLTPPNRETPFTPPTYSPPLTPPNTERSFTPPTYSPPFTPPNTERSFSPPNYPSASETNPANSETPFSPPKYFQTSNPETYSNQPQPQSAPSELEELESNPNGSGVPLWAKVFLSIGLISILSSGILLWLIQKGKISFPSNVNTSWLPGETQSQISPEDAKFADYMRKSISKIESANTQSAPTNPSAISSAPTAIDDANPPTPIAPPTTATVPPTATSDTEIAPLKTTVSLTKTMQTGDRIGATFQIGNRPQTVNVGEKIGKTGWSLSSVAENSIIVVKPGRENKSIAIGQKF